MKILKLTDRDDRPIYFRVDQIISWREWRHIKLDKLNGTWVGSEVVTVSPQTLTVLETVDEIAAMLAQLHDG